MYRLLNVLILAGCILTSVASRSNAGEENKNLPPELKKLYVITVFDTNDEELAKSLLRDKKRLEETLKVTIPKARFEIVASLVKDKVNADNILAAVKALKGKVTKEDSVLLYYGGHGAINEKWGHLLKMTNGVDLRRSTLRKELEGLNAGLVVFLSDCCSTKERFDKTEPDPRTIPSPGIHPTVSHLFFRERGFVDITAASDDAAWSDDKNGGLFTRSLSRLMKRSPEDLIDLKKGKQVTWQRFFPLLQKETEQFFAEWSAAMHARYPNAVIRSKTQRPHAFNLGAEQPKAAYAVVEIENGKSTPLTYKFKWEDPEAEDGTKPKWEEVTLKPGQRLAHTVILPPDAKDGDLPRMEMDWDGVKRVQKLPALMWAEDRAPRNLKKWYKIKK
jgi:hypothetical protein